MSQCTGECCKYIGIPLRPFELKRAYRAWRRGEDKWVDRRGEKRWVPRDIHLVYPMLRYYGRSKRHPEKGVQFTRRQNSEDWSIYTCKHWDRKTRRCTIYQDRPNMCRTFPDVGACRFCGERKNQKEIPAIECDIKKKMKGA